MMEEIREERIGKILSWLQAQARGKISRVAYRKLQEQKVGTYQSSKVFCVRESDTQ